VEELIEIRAEPRPEPKPDIASMPQAAKSAHRSRLLAHLSRIDAGRLSRWSSIPAACGSGA
jgi:hypothetical protein